ncbi:MAG: type II toxin-antitoxin system VapC family toxin [Propionibacteriaceae bacterium]|jgi:predicted nucleic acid-binding protein
MSFNRGVLDTSVFIAAESGRPLHYDLLPEEGVSTVITLAELNVGVLAARESSIRAQRLRTLTRLASMELLGVDTSAAEMWAQMRVYLAERGRRISVNDLWIASIAVSRGLPIVTQDDDFSALEGFPELVVIVV